MFLSFFYLQMNVLTSIGRGIIWLETRTKNKFYAYLRSDTNHLKRLITSRPIGPITSPRAPGARKNNIYIKNSCLLCNRRPILGY